MKRILLINPSPPHGDDTRIHGPTARAAATALALYAVDGSKGRSFGDPVYQQVVEGRQQRAIRAGQFYSSCGDLCHWLLYRLGVRLPRVNRDEHDGWQVGANIWRLIGRAPARNCTNQDAYQPGDILQIGDTNRTTHVLVVLAHDRGAGILSSADYGQPAGARRERSIHPSPAGRLFLGSRPCMRVLPLLETLQLAADTEQLDVAEVPDDFKGGVPAAEEPPNVD